MISTATRSQNCNFEISMNGVRIQQTDSIKQARNWVGVHLGHFPPKNFQNIV